MLAILVLLVAAGGLGVVLHRVVTRQESNKVASKKQASETGEKPDPKGKDGDQKTDPLEKPESEATPEPEQKPEPEEKPEPQPKPEEKPEPKPKPEPPKIDPAKRAEWMKALAGARAAMSQRDLPAAQRHLGAAATSAQTPDETATVQRLERLRGYLEQFWSGIRQSMAELDGGEELVVGDTRVAVVEADAQRLIVRVSGRNRVLQIDADPQDGGIPTSLVRVLADRWFAKQPASKVFAAAFHTVDPKGDREQARRLWQEAAQSGIDVGGLLQEVDSFRGAGQPAGPTTIERIAAPSDAAGLQQAEQLVRQIYQKEYDGTKTATERFRLARQLLADAPGTNDNPEARFVMFREARDLALAAGKASAACEVVDEMAKYFTIDPLAMKVKTLASAPEAAGTLTSHKEIAISALALLQPAIDAKRLDEADQLAKLAVEAAKKARSKAMIKEATSFEQYVEALKAQQP